MQNNELTAVLKRTDEVAIATVHVEGDLPYYVKQKNKRGLTVCPSGLTRAKVIENGHHWTERRPVAACGDRDYEIQRRNGVLVEFPLPESNGTRLAVKGRGKVKALHRDGQQIPHTEVIEHDGQRFVRMIVARGAIIAAWDEYALLEAQREKEAAIARERQERLETAWRALMGDDVPAYLENNLGRTYREFYEYDEKGDIVRVNGKAVKHDTGVISITVERAEEIAAQLPKKGRRR